MLLRDKFECQIESIVQVILLMKMMEIITDEKIFKGDDVQLEKDSFWHELFVLDIDIPILHRELRRFDWDSNGPCVSFNIFLERCIAFMLDYRFPQSMNALTVCSCLPPAYFSNVWLDFSFCTIVLVKGTSQNMRTYQRSALTWKH